MLSFTELAVDIEGADEYAESRGHAAWLAAAASPDTARLAALRRGQDYIAGKYNQRWVEEWENDEAPEQVQYAIYEAAIRELATPGSLAPDLERGGAVKSLKAGSVAIEYMDSAERRTTISAIDNLLRGLVTGANTVTLVRA